MINEQNLIFEPKLILNSF